MKWSNEGVDYYPTITAKETKQTNKEQTDKQNNLLTLTISCEKRRYLIRKIYK